MDILRIGKDMKGSDRDPFKVVCQHSLEVVQKICLKREGDGYITNWKGSERKRS
jgi:hypothetical protein